MTRTLRRWVRYAAFTVLGALVAVLALRAWEAWHAPALAPWHTHVPPELGAADINAADWTRYLQAEERLFEDVETQVVGHALADDDTLGHSRYRRGSPVHPAGFPTNWNRSFKLVPEGPPRGAVVLLHGLTDSPYSLRHVALQYRQRGFLVVAVRLPGHGTVPAALTRAVWPEWLAAARLAVREARREVPAGRPLHLVGYSTGAALAVKYSLDALEDPGLSPAQQLVLLSPMMGLTELSRFAGIAAWPSVLPAFARAAWLDVVPEFNPFKYNSFPVHAATESHALTLALQSQLTRLRASPRLASLPPVLSFVSVVDATVSVRAVVNVLHQQWPAPGNELVLFDVNRAVALQPLMAPVAAQAIESLVPASPRRWRLSLITQDPTLRGPHLVERRTEAGQQTDTVRPIAVRYPGTIVSLSHIAMPFPVSDSLYGLEPSEAEDFGIHLGSLALRGERGVLAVDVRQFMRLSSNPLYPYLAERLDGLIGVP